MSGAIGVPEQSMEDSSFDVGFRSLLARGLVRLDQADVQIRDDARSLGNALARPDDAWRLIYEDEFVIENAVLLAKAGLFLAIVDEGVGIRSATETGLEPSRQVREWVDALALVPDGADSTDWRAIVVVQRLESGEELRLVLTHAGEIVSLKDGSPVVLTSSELDYEIEALERFSNGGTLRAAGPQGWAE